MIISFTIPVEQNISLGIKTTECTDKVYILWPKEKFHV